MKILITGSAGFVGSYLFNYLKPENQIYGLSRRKGENTTHSFDITNPEVRKLLDETAPDIIIHLAALTNVDYCEEHSEEALNINVSGTKNLAEWCKENRKKMIYISTDYVYPGEKNGYDEDSETGPVNFYGETKLEAEKIVRRVNNWVILRPTVIFGYQKEGANFLMQMLNAKTPKKVCDDQISNPTDIKVLCEYINGIIKKDIRGLFVATGRDTLDRFSFALLIAEVFGLNRDMIVRVKTSDLNQKAKRPLNNGTNSSKIRKILDYNCPSLRESLESIKSQLETAH